MTTCTDCKGSGRLCDECGKALVVKLNARYHQCVCPGKSSVTCDGCSGAGRVIDLRTYGTV